MAKLHDTDPDRHAVCWSSSGEAVMVTAAGRDSLRTITMSARQRRELTRARLDAATPDFEDEPDVQTDHRARV